jgi:hypothetical protein
LYREKKQILKHWILILLDLTREKKTRKRWNSEIINSVRRDTIPLILPRKLARGRIRRRALELKCKEEYPME